MPVMTITELFLHDAINLIDFRKFRWTDSTGDDAGNQQADIYAGGNVRVLETVGSISTYSWTIRGVSLEDLQWLRDHRGTFTMVRDSRGVKEFGSYSTVPWKHWKNPRIVDVDLTFTAITYSEAV